MRWRRWLRSSGSALGPTSAASSPAGTRRIRSIAKKRPCCAHVAQRETDVVAAATIDRDRAQGIALDGDAGAESLEVTLAVQSCAAAGQLPPGRQGRDQYERNQRQREPSKDAPACARHCATNTANMPA
ncbi:MAG: hypothetical protein WDW36_010345 [Sanguina aurantia]